MGNGFLVIGTIEEVPKSAALDEHVADFFSNARRKDELLFIAAHYEAFRTSDSGLYLGADQVAIMNRLRANGIIVSGGQEYTGKIKAFENPLITIMPTRRRSLWGMKEYFGRIAQVSTVAIIPTPLLDTRDYEAVVSGMLPELQSKQGQSQLTSFFEAALRRSCLQFIRDFGNVRAEPNKGALLKILEGERKNLKIYFPSSPEFNHKLDEAINTHDFEAARKLIDKELYALPRR